MDLLIPPFLATDGDGLRASIPARFVSTVMDDGQPDRRYVARAVVAQVPVNDGSASTRVVVPTGSPPTAKLIRVQASADIVAYMVVEPGSAADLTTVKTLALGSVRWAQSGWSASQA